ACNHSRIALHKRYYYTGATPHQVAIVMDAFHRCARREHPMYATRPRLLMPVAVLALVSVATGFAQEQKEPPTVRDYCLKVVPGKAAEFETYAHDVVVPLNQSRVDAGEIAWFLLVRGVIPAGTSAKCDYRVVYGYKGLPPETLSDAQIDAALKRAKLNVT